MNASSSRTAGRLALSVLSALISTSFSAQAQVQQLDQVVVTATRSPQKLADVMADVTVIDRDTIERQFTGTLGDLLVSSGVAELSRNGGPTATTSLFLRGGDSRHTVVLVDGMRMDSQATGGASWQGIPLSQIERVEIVKGPASSVYGSDAVAGVVQIFTRKSSGKTAAEVGLAFGNHGSTRLDGYLAGGDKSFDYAVSVTGEQSKGFNATTPDNTYGYIADKDGWKSQGASLRLGATLAQGQRLEFSGFASHADTQYDADAFTPQADDHSIQDNRSARLLWSADWSRDLHTEVSLGQSTDHYETKSFNNPYPYPYATDTRLRQLTLLTSWKMDSSNQFNLQLERREDKLDNTSLTNGGLSGVDTRSNNGAALGWIFTSHGFDLQLQGRHDSDSQYGGVNTGTIAAGYSFGDGWRAYASGGNAFRAPTLYQRGSDSGPDLSKPGVSPLDPERGHNRELGLRWDGESAGFTASLYKNKVNDLIVYGAPGTCASPYGCYANVAAARLQGVSLAGNATVGNVKLSATFDAQSPEDASTGKRLARRAQHFGTLRAETRFAGWDVGSTLRFSGARFNDAANTQELGGYALLDLDARYAITPSWTVFGKLDNAFNHNYTLAQGYATQPRQFFVGVRYALK